MSNNVIETYNANRQTASEILKTHHRHSKVCYSQDDIHLIQKGRDNFTVIYFLQVKTDLDYSQAAKELGACIMHNAACDGKLDNRGKGE
jgi:hypothetical protein